LDLYKIFLEKWVTLLQKEWYLSFINPSVFLINDYDIVIRKFFLEWFSINEIVNSKKDIFEDATVKTCIFTIKNIKPSKNTEIKFSNIKNEIVFEDKKIKQSIFCENKYLINENVSVIAIPIINKIKKDSVKIWDYFEITLVWKLYNLAKRGLRPNSTKYKNAHVIWCT
jgi:hypothetical protein